MEGSVSIAQQHALTHGGMKSLMVPKSSTHPKHLQRIWETIGNNLEVLQILDLVQDGDISK